MLHFLSDVLSQLFVSADGRERTPTWLGGAIVFGSMGAVIVGLWLMRWA